MKKLLTLLFIVLAFPLVGQVKIYNDASDLVTVEYSASNIKKASANADLSIYNVGDYIWMEKTLNGVSENLFRNQRFDITYLITRTHKAR